MLKLGLFSRFHVGQTKTITAVKFKPGVFPRKVNSEDRRIKISTRRSDLIFYVR